MCSSNKKHMYEFKSGFLCQHLPETFMNPQSGDINFAFMKVWISSQETLKHLKIGGSFVYFKGIHLYGFIYY